MNLSDSRLQPHRLVLGSSNCAPPYTLAPQISRYHPPPTVSNISVADVLFRDAGSSSDPATPSCELARRMVAHCQTEARRILWDLRDSQEVTHILSHALSHAFHAHRPHERIETTLRLRTRRSPSLPVQCITSSASARKPLRMLFVMPSPPESRLNCAYDSESRGLTVRDKGCGFNLSDHAIRTGHFGIW